jgi:sortase (surface protein transpeptidase)
MKKIIILSLIIFSLFSCTNQEIQEKKLKNTENKTQENKNIVEEKNIKNDTKEKLNEEQKENK